MQWFGIDVSRWQGDFNFKQAMAEGVQFAILKAGGGDDGLYKDSQFENNYKKCKSLGLPIGAYFFGAAKTVERAQEEADYFLSLLKGKKFEMPVYYDVEGNMLNLNTNLLTDICLTFMDRVESAGWFTGIYGNPYSFNTKIDDERIMHFCHWVAYWATTLPKLNSGMSVGIWQFGGETNKIRTNKVAGVTCDQNYCYVDYPSAIIDLGLNGYGDEPTPDPEPLPTLDAVEPKLGYGDFNDRVAKLQKSLKELGYDVGNDGLYDERVRQAMKDWQESVGLEVTGEYGIADYNKMVASPLA